MHEQHCWTNNIVHWHCQRFWYSCGIWPEIINACCEYCWLAITLAVFLIGKSKFSGVGVVRWGGVCQFAPLYATTSYATALLGHQGWLGSLYSHFQDLQGVKEVITPCPEGADKNFHLWRYAVFLCVFMAMSLKLKFSERSHTQIVTPGSILAFDDPSWSFLLPVCDL